ncbi:hypothetical protein EDB95_2089 [Dinghuibacter silviterrae]|uniref:Uncharacterized protein n=2 Tax=Dinghuibacter silviterrae TaxID=1539049 RepID=A0A4R8DT38_9BACT|nr:hypothetical protein EDB95_2089 [Dinghuibacter silviterrae]
MVKYPNLIPECNVDTVFVEAIGFKEPNHASSIAGVLAILERAPTKENVIGFIDNDKKKPLYFKQFESVKEMGSVGFYKHVDKNRYLVVVRPAMDKFLFDLCVKYINNWPQRVPNTFEAFLPFTKQTAVLKNNDFKNLLNTLVQAKPPEIVEIKDFVLERGFRPTRG